MQTCPKCQHVRQPNETAPDWQCPACGVAYAKAADAARAHDVRKPAFHAASTAEDRRFAWRKWVLLVALVGGLVSGIHVMQKRHGEASGAGNRLGGGMSTEQMHTLASTVKAGEVVMYTTTECPYCAQAKGWLHQNGFAFNECNMSVSRECEREFLSYGGNGTPYLVVRGQHMKDGFDSDQFLALLKQ
jgi:glutaredoxin/predicted RNA-binding Zn-ribbon protein involved in translation (DUF1610 family)